MWLSHSDLIQKIQLILGRKEILNFLFFSERQVKKKKIQDGQKTGLISIQNSVLIAFSPGVSYSVFVCHSVQRGLYNRLYKPTPLVDYPPFSQNTPTNNKTTM